MADPTKPTLRLIGSNSTPCNISKRAVQTNQKQISTCDPVRTCLCKGCYGDWSDGITCGDGEQCGNLRTVIKTI